MWDPIRHRVMVLDELVPTHVIAVDRLDDLAFVGVNVVVLSGRSLTLYAGDAVSTLPVPDLVPTHIDLLVDSSSVWGVDPFGNRHAIARVDGDRLLAPDGPSFGGRAHDPAPTRAAGLKSSVRPLGHGWFVVEVVTDDRPIAVTRTVEHSGRSVEIATADRAWVPTTDLTVDADGRLVAIVPLADGLHVRRITP